VLALLGGAVLVTHSRVLNAGPSADDFLIPVVVRTMEAQDPWHVFVDSPQPDYRPLQWITAWLFTRSSLQDPFPTMHLMSFIALIPYLAVFGLWVRRLRLQPGPAVCACALLCFHPLLAGPLGEVDAFPRLIVSALVWFGVYLAERFASRLAIGIPLAAGCLALGLGLMEYAVSLAVVAPAVAYLKRDSRRLLGAAGMGLAMLVVIGGYLAFRHVAVPQEAANIALSPRTWLANTAVILGGLLYPGNTVAVMLGEGSSRFVLMSAGCIVTAVLITIGLVLAHRRARPDIRSVLPLVLALFAASFAPMFAMRHVSEMYLTAPLFGLALVVGCAAEGWWASAKARLPFLLTFVILLAWSLQASSSKINSIIDRGDRAGRQIQSLLQNIPDHVRDTRVWLVFREPGRGYSVFAAGDDGLIQREGPAYSAAEWFLPGRNIRWDHVVGTHEVSAPPSANDIVLCWVAATRSFSPGVQRTCAGVPGFSPAGRK
jgi:hypothetical protein